MLPVIPVIPTLPFFSLLKHLPLLMWSLVQSTFHPLLPDDLRSGESLERS